MGYDLYEKHFRVAIFGSARITKKDPAYEEVYKLAYMIAGENIDVVTGGGPGIMEAGNKGAHLNGGTSVGLNIALPFEQHDNPYIDHDTRRNQAQQE